MVFFVTEVQLRSYSVVVVLVQVFKSGLLGHRSLGENEL